LGSVGQVIGTTADGRIATTADVPGTAANREMRTAGDVATISADSRVEATGAIAVTATDRDPRGAGDAFGPPADGGVFDAGGVKRAARYDSSAPFSMSSIAFAASRDWPMIGNRRLG